jgi:hypothetical protein
MNIRQTGIFKNYCSQIISLSAPKIRKMHTRTDFSIFTYRSNTGPVGEVYSGGFAPAPRPTFLQQRRKVGKRRRPAATPHRSAFGRIVTDNARPQIKVQEATSRLSSGVPGLGRRPASGTMAARVADGTHGKNQSNFHETIFRHTFQTNLMNQADITGSS